VGKFLCFVRGGCWGDCGASSIATGAGVEQHSSTDETSHENEHAGVHRALPALRIGAMDEGGGRSMGDVRVTDS